MMSARITKARPLARMIGLVAVVVLMAVAAPVALATVQIPSGSIPVPTSGSFLYLNSQPGDYIGQGAENLYTPANSNLHGAPPQGGTRFNGWIDVGSLGSWNVDLAAPAGQPLIVGSYTAAARMAVRPAGAPGLDVNGFGRGCNTLTGQFDVTEIAFSTLGEITVFDAMFEQHCENMAPALYGRIRIEIAAPAAGSTLPSGSIGVPTAGTFLYLANTGSVNGPYEQLYTAADSAFNYSLGTDTFHASVVQGNYIHWWNVDIDVPLGQSLAVGSYLNAVRAMSRTASAPGLDLSGDGGGCNTLTGSFAIDQLTFAWNGALLVFQSTFHLYCDGSPYQRHGRIRIENPPPPPLPPLQMSVTLRDEGTVSNRTGVAVISGTLSCSRDIVADFSGTLTQVVSKNLTVTRPISGTVPCVAPSSPWTLAVSSDGGFGASSATATLEATRCDDRCYRATAAGTIQLNSSK